MAIFTKITSTAPFTVPSLADSSHEYAGLLAKQLELHGRLSTLRSERRVVEEQMRNAPRAEYNSRIAALLDEAVDADSSPRRRLAEINAGEQDVVEALEVVRQRLVAAKGPASAKVREASRAEHARRVQALAKALEATAAAHVDYDQMVADFEAESIEWTALAPLQAHFLGSSRDGHISHWLKCAKEAGYVS